MTENVQPGEPGTGTCIDKPLDSTSRYTGIPKGEGMQPEADVPTKIKMLLKEKPNGLTIEDIAKSLPLNRITTVKYLNALLISGQLECQAVGRAKLFRCCSRVPMSQMLSFNSDAIIVMDRELLIREINPQFITVFGLPEQDVTGKKFDALPPEVDIVHILMPGICQLNGQIFTKNHEIQKGNEMLHFRSKYIPVVFDDGVPGIAVILADVTEHHHIQQKYEKLLHETTIQRESANTPIVSDVSEHNVEITSDVSEHNVEITPEVSEHNVQNSPEVSEQVCRMDALQQNFLALTEHDENLLAREQEVQSNNLELVSQRDALHRNDDLFHAIFDYEDDAVFLIRLNPDGTPGKYIDVNEAACQHLGYSRTELQGMPVGDHQSRTSQSLILPIISGWISEPSNGWFDATYTRDDGTVIPAEASVHIIPHGAEKIAMVAFRER